MRFKFFINILILILAAKAFAAPVTQSKIELQIKELLRKANIIFSYNGIISNKNIPSKVVCFAERHDTIKDKKELIKALPALKKAGFTHLAIEMIPQSMQDLLDNPNKENDQLLLAHLQSAWGQTPENPAALLELIQEARKYVKVVGLDASASNEQRSYIWAQMIFSILRINEDTDYKIKVIVYGGDYHFGYPEQKTALNMPFNQILEEDYGISSTVFKFAGGLKKTENEPPSIITEQIAYIAQQQGKKQKYLITLNRENRSYIDRTADFVVLLP